MSAIRISADEALAAWQALQDHGGNGSAAAESLGLSRSSFRRRVDAARQPAFRGAVGGPPIPPIAVPPPGFVIRRNAGAYDANGNLLRQWVQTKTEPGEAFEMLPGHVIKGESAFVDPDGRVLGKWVKTREGAAGAGLVEALQTAFAEYDGAALPVAPPSVTTGDLLTIYPVPDLHFGMYAWGAETGADYDVGIASRIARETVGTLIAKSDASETAVILGLGDLFHMNDQKNATPGSGHRLDVDGRWDRVFDLGARLILDLVVMALAKHATVRLVLLPGNHDEDASVCLRVALALYFSENPRVIVHTEPGLFWYFRFGASLFGATHGHNVKPDRMAMAMASDQARDWGETLHRYFFFGHVHHDSMREIGSVRVESFQTPAAKDAWATGAGYRSGRSMSSITYHRDVGEIARHRVNITAPAPRPRYRVPAAQVSA
ncbi:MAG: helix-turn-helix domain-containing protein [Sphingomonas sp.]